MGNTSSNSTNLCPQCNEHIDVDSKFCKHCGYNFSTSNATQNQLTNNTPNRTKDILLALGIVVIILLGYVGYRLKSPPTNEYNNSQSTTATSSFTMSGKAQQAEEKILKGESLSESDLSGLSVEELRILRNVNFAKYGRKYDPPGPLSDYFSSRPWYKPRDDYKDSDLNQVDKDNVKFILAIENGSSNSNTTGDSAPSVASTPYQPQAPSYENKAIQTAKKNFSSVVTECGGSYYTKAQSGPITQYKDVQFIVTRVNQLTEADRLNGIEWAGVVEFRYSASRPTITYIQNNTIVSSKNWDSWRTPLTYAWMAPGVAKNKSGWFIYDRHGGALGLSAVSCSDVP